MPGISNPREGIALRAHSRAVPYSFWPTGGGSPRPPVQSLLFATDPWAVMRSSIVDTVIDAAAQSEALSYILQASDFYNSALSGNLQAAKPVQLYYAYLNVLKAFVICRGRHLTLPDIHHGINESVIGGGVEFYDGILKFWTSPNRRGALQAFDEYVKALDETPLINEHQIKITEILPQILSGHRLWSAAAGQNERFISVQRIQFVENRRTRQVWLRIYLFLDDIKRLGYTQKEVIENSGLAGTFEKVRCSGSVDERPLMCLEQIIPTTYTRHGADMAIIVAKSIKNKLWATVGSSPPYRRYYVYVCPPAELASLLPQVTSIFALTFYLGSVTRYRPNAFRDLLNGPFSTRISEFVAGHSAQFIYLMASEFAKRDVTRPSIV